jgi:hypothetical protein
LLNIKKNEKKSKVVKILIEFFSIILSIFIESSFKKKVCIKQTKNKKAFNFFKEILTEILILFLYYLLYLKIFSQKLDFLFRFDL